MLRINLKWNKSAFDNVEFDPALGVKNLKNIVWKLTNVPPDRQKLMAKGAWPGILKDDGDLTMMAIKTGQQVLLMGTADLVQNTGKSLFLEDMSLAEIAQTGTQMPAGFVNLGNTCFLNSIVQVLRYTPALRESIKTVRPGNDGESVVVGQMRDALGMADNTVERFMPMSFVNAVRSAYPQFAQRTDHGGFMQQDAEEFFNTIALAVHHSISGASDLMELEFDEHLQCLEDNSAPVTIKRRCEKVNKLVCNIKGSVAGGANPELSGETIDASTGAVVDASVSSSVSSDGLTGREAERAAMSAANSSNRSPIANTMNEGIALNMEGVVEKFSDTLQRNAMWKRHWRIAKLPKYICVHFMRFFWKLTPESRDHTGTKCKILRPCVYPENFDIYPLCNAELQGALKSNRDAEQKAITESFEMNKKPKLEESPAAESSNVAMDLDDDDALQAALAMSMGGGPPESSSETKVPPFHGCLPDDFTGIYELYGIVTHKGRSADSGHYIGWVRKENSDIWWKFDDDTVTEVSTKDVMDLKGGGDWHTAYLNFYRYKTKRSDK